jgi:hypothetical protein
VDLNVHPSQPLDQHPGDIPTDQTLVVAMTMEVVVAVMAEDHQLGVTQMQACLRVYPRITQIRTCVIRIPTDHSSRVLVSHELPAAGNS